MDFANITKKAKQVFTRRGGSGALKEDAGELKDIATGQGSLADKGKQAATAVKEPGAAAPPEGPARETETSREG
jgi:hypothetical protein